MSEHKHPTVTRLSASDLDRVSGGIIVDDLVSSEEALRRNQEQNDKLAAKEHNQKLG